MERQHCIGNGGTASDVRFDRAVMVNLKAKLALTGVLAAALWVVPSVGTQGMGTLGQRFSHPDDRLVHAATATADRAVLQRADLAVLVALERRR